MLYFNSRPFTERKNFAQDIERIVQQENEIPKKFATLEEARAVFNQIMCFLCYITLMFDENLPYGSQRDIIPLHAKCIAQFAKWNETFTRYIHTESTQLSGRGLRGAALLQLHHMVAHIMANGVSPSSIDEPQQLHHLLYDESKYVIYNSKFHAVLGLARSLLSESNKDMKPSDFTPDFGLLAPLHYCCINCPDHTVRMEMLDLLQRHSRREGMWESVTTVSLIQKKWKRLGRGDLHI
jgi:hypothetical protein